MSDRLDSAISALFDAFLPRIAYHLVWEYSVQATYTSGGLPPVTADLKSLNPTVPDVVGMTIWAGPDGSVAVPATGSIVRVGFANGDSTKPMIVGLDTTTPITVYLAGGGHPVALADKVSTELANIATSIASIVYQPGAAHPTAYTPGSVASTKVQSG